jgi:protein-arginine kinase activator protein McsA
MSTKYVCDWCYEEFPDRAQVAHADVTVGAHAELLHICAACAPNHLADHFPDEPETAVDCGEPVTDGGSRLRCASCRKPVTLDDTLELQAPEISDGTIARVRVCEDCRPDAGNKRPVTAYKDLLKTVIKRANGIEEEQATLGEDEWDPETAELRDGETTDVDSHVRRNAEQLRMAEEHLEDDDDLVTDGGRDQDETEFFVVDEDRGAVVAGPFDVKETAAEKALDRGPSHIVATEAVLEMIEVTSSTTIRWENEDVDVVTDGGQDIRSELTDGEEEHGKQANPNAGGDEYEPGQKRPLDHGVKVRGKVKRGTGTRDQDELLIEGRGENAEEAALDFEEALTAAEEAEWVDRLRALQPGEAEDDE